MDANQRIRELMNERGWTEYRLALNSGLSKSTVSAMLHRNTLPSLQTLEVICDAFGITISQFFSEAGESLTVDEEQRKLLQQYGMLSENQKQLVKKLIEELLK